MIMMMKCRCTWPWKVLLSRWKVRTYVVSSSISQCTIGSRKVLSWPWKFPLSIWKKGTYMCDISQHQPVHYWSSYLIGSRKMSFFCLLSFVSWFVKTYHRIYVWNIRDSCALQIFKSDEFSENSPGGEGVISLSITHMANFSYLLKPCLTTKQCQNVQTSTCPQKSANKNSKKNGG